MKSLKTRIFLIFLSSLILFNSLGLGLIEHSCAMRSNKTYSFIKKDTCKGCERHYTKHTGKTNLKRTKCCDNKQIDISPKVGDSIIYKAEKTSNLVFQTLTNNFNWIFSVLKSPIIQKVDIYSSHPPHFFGKSLLIFINLFRL